MAAIVERKRVQAWSCRNRIRGISWVPYSESKPELEEEERHKSVAVFGIYVNGKKLIEWELELSTTNVEKFLRQDSLALALVSEA